MTRAILLLTFAAIAVASVVDTEFDLEQVDRQKKACGNRCEFRLCRATGILDDARPKGTRVLLRDANIAAPPFVCLPGTTLGKIRKTGTAMASTRGGPLKPINKIKVKPRLSKKFFSLRPVDFPVLPGKFGLTHLTTTSKQWKALNDLCVVIPIVKYDVVMPDGSVKKVSSKSPTSCVSFVASAPKLLIEFTWDSPDDFDLELQEPGSSGELINLGNPRSAAGGKLNSDNNVGECDVDKTGKEQISYVQSANPPSGTYTVRGRHFNNCGDGPTRWNIAVVSNGVAILNRSGSSNLDDNDIAFEFDFSI